MTDSPSKPAVGSAPGDKIGAMNLWQKLAAITGEVGIIAKDGTNDAQKYKFIENAAVAGRLRELYGKYHIDFSPEMLERTERPLSSGKGVNILCKMRFTFTNADKPEEIQEAIWEGESSDYGDKGTNKAATAAEKSYQMKKFNISEKGDDPDAVGIEDTPAKSQVVKPKKPNIKDVIDQAIGVLSYKGFTDADERKAVVLKIAGASAANELTADKLDHVMQVLAATTGDELRGYLQGDKTEKVAQP